MGRKHSVRGFKRGSGNSRGGFKSAPGDSREEFKRTTSEPGGVKGATRGVVSFIVSSPSVSTRTVTCGVNVDSHTMRGRVTGLHSVNVLSHRNTSFNNC